MFRDGKETQVMTWIYGGDLLETVREEEGGWGGERLGDWNMRGLTWRDSRGHLRSKSKAKRWKLKPVRSAGVRWPARWSARGEEWEGRARG